MQRIEADPLVTVGATLGEGPVWVERDQSLWFVDIKAPCIYRFKPASGQLSRWQAPAAVGWILPSADGAFVVGLRDGLYHFSPDEGRFTHHAGLENHPPSNRLNDATVDADGRIWFGTMDDEGTMASGRFYVHDRGVVRETGIAPVVITNGPVVGADGRTLYAVDTLGGTVDAYPIIDGARLGERQRFVTIERDVGVPDGPTADAEGGIWIGIWGGSVARRYDATGSLTHEVRFPVANITKVALGGPDGMTGYATTARAGLDAAALAAQPLAGDVFAFRAPFPGVPLPDACFGNDGGSA